MKQLTHLKLNIMKNTTKILKDAGYKVVKYTAPNNVILENSLTGRASKSAKVLENSKGEILHIDGKVYMPIGGASAFVELLPYLQNEGFSFIQINSILKNGKCEKTLQEL